jgi:LTXXQ motif family protein
MSKTRFFAIIAICTVLAGAAYAAPGRGGGGGRPGGGGGGAHFGGGGGMRMGGGAPHMGGGGMRMGGGQHFGGGARMGGMHGGGAPRFSGRPAGAPRFAARPNGGGGPRSFAGRGNRFAGHDRAANINPAAGIGRNRNAGGGFTANRQASARSNAVRNALRSRAVAGALHRTGALRSPNARAHIAAAAAIAGWHQGHGQGRFNGGWWRHRNGGYGWVGPVFWPFAYDDIYDYTLWGYGNDDPFWGYGYGDIYAGLFSPYDYDALAGYWPQGGNGGGARRSQAFAQDTGSAPPEQLVQMCGEDKSDIAGLPLDQIQKAIKPDDAQRAALDDLAKASAKAAQDIKAACPSQIALTAPARLADMQTRIEAMIAAVGTVQPPLQKFYDLLNDDQKTRLNALGQNQQRTAAPKKNSGGSLAQSCGAEQANIAPNITPWPSADIEAKLHPTEAQRASLAALQDATAKASDMLKAACPPNDDAITPTARLEAAGRRLDVLLQAVKSVRTALDDFYGKLSDEQKAQFEAIGPSRQAAAADPSGTTGQSTASAASHGRFHRRHASVGGMIRRLMSVVR